MVGNFGLVFVFIAISFVLPVSFDSENMICTNVCNKQFSFS